MTRIRWGLLILGVVAGSCAAGAGLLVWSHSNAPSTKRARASIEQILFLTGDRVLVRNELGDLFASSGGVGAWEELDDRAFGLAVADHNEIWGALGILSHHTAPSGTIWHSRDGGLNWEETELSVPSEFMYSDPVLSRLPLQFIQEPPDPPLLLMFNLQLMRPKSGRDVDTWDRVGRRVPTPTAHRAGEASGLQHDGTIYVGANNQIFMSTDRGRTWSSKKVHSFFDAHIRCRKDRCYALLSELGSRWEGVFTTRPGTNTWTELGTLNDSAIAAALEKQAEKFGTIKSFGATAILPTTDGVYVAGILAAGPSAWGAVLVLSDSGKLRGLAGAVPGGFWELAKKPNGSLWAGGHGAHEWTSKGWRQVWVHPDDAAMRTQ